MYQRVQISSDVEKDIITGLITDSRFGREIIAKTLKPEHFSSRYTHRIATWVINYYKKYDKAPFMDMVSIFNAEKSKLKQEEQDLIEALLNDISERYANTDASKLNTEYMIDKTRTFCQSRNLSMLVAQIDDCLQKGQVEKATGLVQNFGNISSTTSKWMNPFDKDTVYKAFEEDDSDNLFKLPGLLGDLVGGYLKRDWLVAYMGPAKRGKSWRIQDDIAFEALTNDLKVAYVSLEMSEKDVRKRMYARLTAGAKKDGQIIIPVFDCLSNQNGDCMRLERINNVTLPFEILEDKIPMYDSQIYVKYLPCTYCRRKREADYIPSIWYEVYQAQKMTPEMVVKKIDSYSRMFEQNLRVISYPPFGANFDQIITDIEGLEYEESFVPDVVVVDYFDIMGDEPGKLDQRGQIDARWKKGKALAKKKHCLVATVSQSGRASFLKDNIDEEDTSEDIRKMAHADLYMGLNQTRAEKMAGVMRINIMSYRHDDFNILSQVMVLQSLALGQPYLDAEYCPKTYARIYGRPFTRKKTKK